MALRAAIGADRWRIARQLLTESTLLVVIGGGIGVSFAVLGTNVLLAASPRNLLDVRSISFDLRVLVFAVGVTLLAAWFLVFYPLIFRRIREFWKHSRKEAAVHRQEDAGRWREVHSWLPR